MLPLVLLLASCTAQPSPPSRREAAPRVPGTSPAGPPAGRDCGGFYVGHLEHVPPSAVTCLNAAAAARRSARLVVTFPTVEGDPVITRYEVRTDGRVAVTIDARADRYGRPEVSRRVCAGVATAAGGTLRFPTCDP